MKTDTLRKAIAREEAVLAELSYKRDESQKRLAVLKSELAALESIPAHPSEFISHLLDLDPGAVCNAAKQQRQALRNPTKSPEEFLDTLLRQGLAGTVAQLEEMIDLL